MKKVKKIFFSDYFDVKEEHLSLYGAYNISLVSDLPLFIDPFLLFNSNKDEYQRLHEKIIDYLRFLRKKSLEEDVEEGALKHLYTFSEVWQNWFGFTASGNKGSALGPDFARTLNANFQSIFTHYGQPGVTRGTHLEKLCLFKKGVGKDNISDFTTNLIKEYLLEYTENFAKRYIDSKYIDAFRISKVRFNYKTETWEEGEYHLPRYGNGSEDYVLLTPRDILTKDSTWINRNDLLRQLLTIPASLDNEELRYKVNNYLRKILPEDSTRKQENNAAEKLLLEFPELADYYIKRKENSGNRAQEVSQSKVEYTEELYHANFNKLALLLEETPFYEKTNGSYKEALECAQYLKHVVEDKDGYTIFYVKGEAVERESDLEILYKLLWRNSEYDFNSQVNNGRGPVDGVVSMGSKDKTNIDFKLASNTHLKSGLEKQMEIYEKAGDADGTVIIILYFTQAEHSRVLKVLKDLKLESAENILLIDARKDNKPAASKVR